MFHISSVAGTHCKSHTLTTMSRRCIFIMLGMWLLSSIDLQVTYSFRAIPEQHDMMMMAGRMRFMRKMVMTKDWLCSFMSLQARVQDRPKDSGPYFPHPIRGKRAQSSAYIHVVATSSFALLLLIFSSMDRDRHFQV